jgi:hypothetical protein
MRTRIARALDRRFHALGELVTGLSQQVEALRGAVGDEREEIHALRDQIRGLEARVQGLEPQLRFLVAEEPGNRRRLHAARSAPSYEAAYTDPRPLVSVSIITRDRPGLLRERSLPSVLAQTHGEIEVIVVGDQPDFDLHALVAEAGDERVRATVVGHRVVHDDPRKHWMTATVLTRNEAYMQARGAWLVDLDDDDALRPDAVEMLLADARARRLEVVYGTLEQHAPDGSTERLGGFPPTRGQFGWQGALVHSGLRIFEREFIASELGLPGDWWRLERMLRAGVRIGHLERVTADYYPSTLWPPGAPS